jgi:hypothetical protein
VFIGEFLMLSYINGICNGIGSIILILGGFAVILLNKNKEIKYYILFVFSLILAILSPVLIRNIPYCKGYEVIQYSVLTVIISVFYCIPYLYMMLKKSPLSKKSFIFILIFLAVSALLVVVPHLITLEILLLR